MILVNYLGYFEAMPDTFKHPRYGMTFANAIAPFFVFAVGMGLRLSLKRRIVKQGSKTAYWHAASRYLILILIGIVVYGPDPVMDMWDALVDIGFAGLLTLPFIASSKKVRMIGALGLLTLYQLIFVFTGYGAWTMPNSIDGGPLGPISWASILVFGTIQMDYLNEVSAQNFIVKSLKLGILLMLAGLGISFLQPMELWEMSQRSMTIAYPLFASGLSMLTFLLFYILADMRKIKVPHMAVLGMNPLVIYIIQQVLIEFYGDLLPKSAHWSLAILGFLAIYSICFLIARYLYRNKYFIKI